jgi:hypothetical protein
MSAGIIHRIVNKAFKVLNRVLTKIGGSYENRYTRPTGFMNQGPEKEFVEYEERLHLHWQNLNDDKNMKAKGAPYRGRCWLWIRPWKGRQHNIGFEWNLWQPHWLYSFHIDVDGSGGGDDDLKFGIAIFPISFHLSFSRVFPKSFKDWWHKTYDYSAREIWYYASFGMGGGLRFCGHFWRDPMEGKSPKTFLEKIRDFSITVPDDIISSIFGKLKHSTELLEERDVKIPMPEGPYEGHVKLERTTWKRDRLPFASKVRVGSVVDIPIGIPFEGKGENSWDCGEDGLFGCSSDEDSYPAAIAKTVEIALKYRTKYNHNLDAVYPHPDERKKVVEARRAAAANDPTTNGVANA